MHYQNETRILIKNKTNMKAVEKKQETKSEYNDDIYFVTPKAFQKLEKTYTCTRYDVYSLTD